MTHSPYFLKNLEISLKQTLDIPMWGKAPEFPWNAFTEKLKEIFEKESILLSCIGADWKSQEELEEGFSASPLVFSFNMAPLAPSFYLMIAPDDVLLLSKLLLDQEGKRTFADAIFQKGFSQFILLHLLRAFDEISPYEGLKARLSSKPLLKETSYCIDVSLDLEKSSILIRCILPESFHRIVTSHFSSKPLPLQRLDSSLEIPLSLQVGKVSLTHSEWSTISLGDFIILDEGMYQPQSEQGTFFLSLGMQRLFILKRKHHEVKILDYALYNFNSFEKEDLEMEMEDNDTTEDLEFEETSDENASENNQTQALLSSEQVPLTLLVEIGKVSMPLKEVLALKPGNLLPLGSLLDQSVVLTLNSKPVARGQLVQLGALVGVKISEIAH
jgi:flagellar motor switch protein FliN/FliY